MSMNDTMARVLSDIHNAEKIGRTEFTTGPAAKLILNVLKLFKEHGYVEDFKVVDDKKGGKIVVTMKGQINKCGVIKPRFPVKVGNFEKWERRFLPGSNIGLLIVSTPKGIMTQKEAQKKGLGGVLIAYVY